MMDGFWNLPGVWIATAAGLFMAVNAMRSLSRPEPFAAYLGLPLADPRDAGMVWVYGLRALFIALAVSALLVLGDPRPLGWLCAAAVVMPVGDAVLTRNAGAPRATVIRHMAIAAVLATAAVLLLVQA